MGDGVGKGIDVVYEGFCFSECCKVELEHETGLPSDPVAEVHVWELSDFFLEPFVVPVFHGSFDDALNVVAEFSMVDLRSIGLDDTVGFHLLYPFGDRWRGEVDSPSELTHGKPAVLHQFV